MISNILKDITTSIYTTTTYKKKINLHRSKGKKKKNKKRCLKSQHISMLFILLLNVKKKNNKICVIIMALCSSMCTYISICLQRVSSDDPMTIIIKRKGDDHRRTNKILVFQLEEIIEHNLLMRFFLFYCIFTERMKVL